MLIKASSRFGSKRRFPRAWSCPFGRSQQPRASKGGMLLFRLSLPSTTCLAFKLAQLLLGSGKLRPECTNLFLQPFNVCRTALVGGEWLASCLQGGELVGELSTKQHLALGLGDFHAPFDIGPLCLAGGGGVDGVCRLRKGGTCQGHGDGQSATTDVHTST